MTRTHISSGIEVIVRAKVLPDSFSMVVGVRVRSSDGDSV